MLRGTVRCCAAWGANPADIKFTSMARREGQAFLQSARKKQEFKPLDERAQKMALSVGSPEYPMNEGLTSEQLHVNSQTGEVGGYPGLSPTRYGDWEKGGRCIDF